MILRVFIILFAVLAVACNGTNKKEKPLSNEELKEFEQLIDEGKTLAKANESEKAITVFRKALNIDSTRVEANYGLAYALAKFCQKDNARCQEALWYYNKTIEIDPNYRNSYFNRSFTRFLLGDVEGALDDANKAILQKPADGDYYGYRASLYFVKEDSANGCADIQKAITLGAEIKDTEILKFCEQ